MNHQGKAIRLTELQTGIFELCFDRQGDIVNKFDQATLVELSDVLGLIDADATVRGVLISSAKPEYFIVGADVTEFGPLFSSGESALLAALARANAIFNRLEDLRVPSVVAINGSALGGGFELCLAADARVASSKSRVGLPEVRLGLQPGFGGTVRLPRVIGIDNAVEWICGGVEQKPDVALRVGAVDAVVSPEQLHAAALDLLTQCLDGRVDYRARRLEKTTPVKLNEIELTMALMTGGSVVAAQAGPNMPAPVTAVKSIGKSAVLAREAALQVEAQHFCKLAMSKESSSLIGLFLGEQIISRKARSLTKAAKPVKRAAVLGAGTMGGGIAYQSASCGVPVIMKDIAEQGLQLGMVEAGKLLSGQVSRGKLSAEEMAGALGSIRPTLEYSDFSAVDIVVEAIVENEGVKRKVLAECETKVAPGTVLTSNTSTISITRLAEGLAHPENFCGMHFFNPVHRMPLVEVIRGEKSSDAAIATTVAYALALKKTPIVVRDCPGFLVNRVLSPYFHAFNLLVRDGADIVQVDRVMEKFGWPMGPAYLLDVIGIDVARHAGGVMAAGFPDRMKADFRSSVDVLFEAKRLGQKSGFGFYRYQQDKRGRPVKSVDAELAELLREVRGEPRQFSDLDIIERLMVPMCNETVRCLDEGIVGSAAEADMALIMGIGFPPFRGGALRYLDQTGLAAFCAIADRYAALAPVYQVPESLRQRAAASRGFHS